MTGPHQPHLTIQGGRGGDGGQGGGQGGGGGLGYGPNVNAGPGTINVHYHGEAENPDIIINWLSPINFFLRQAEISGVRAEGTGNWLLVHPLFKKWESGSGGTLWCYGIPGAGKTVLASMVVEHLNAAFTNNKDIGVACIYLNHKEADSQTPSRLLAALWRQLVVGRDLGSIVETSYEQHRQKGTVPSLQEVASILSSSLQEFSQVFIVIDAIDEYPEDQCFILLKHLAHLAEQNGLSLSVKVMVTSRPHIAAGSTLPNVATLEIGAMPEDIQRFVNAQIDSSSRLSSHVQRQPQLRADIHSKISAESVDGMFLLAKLHIESLRTKNTIWDVREALKALPKDLYGSYEIAIERIKAQTEEDRKTAHLAITWVANAKRPLTIEELQVALAVRPGMRQLNNENLADIKVILAVCAGLVIVDKESSVVRLVHYTAQAYLDKIQAEKFPDAQVEITRTLLTVLNFDGYPHPSWSNYQATIPPLLEYSQYCLAHAAGQPEVQLRKPLLEFLEQAFQWKKTMWWRWNFPPWDYSDWPSQPSALWIAAAANLTKTVTFLLEEAPLAQHSDCPEISVASYYGWVEIVHILLKKGAKTNAVGGRFRRLLQAATTRGHKNINAAEGKYEYSLQAAVARGHTEIVRILVEKGANINAAGGEYGSSLQAAIIKGHTDIACILLQKGANINAGGGRYGSSLQAAAAEGHTEIACILLEKGADVNAAGGRYGSSLQASTARGHIDIFHILLGRGANVNAAGGQYGSVLQAAATKGHTEIVHILVEKGANVNATGGRYGSALQAAAYQGHTEIVRILLAMGANINEAGGEHGTALEIVRQREKLFTSMTAYNEIMYILLESSAKLSAPVENEGDEE